MKGLVPTDKSTTIISPIFKKGNCENAGSYGPVSFMSTIGKFMEPVLKDKIKLPLHLICTKSKSQYCFMQQQTSLANLLIIENIVDIGFQDFAKVSESVNHEILCTKLFTFGMDIATVKMIILRQAWYIISSYGEACMGILQVSVIGQLIFLLYINDCVYPLDGNLCMFADYMKLI